MAAEAAQAEPSMDKQAADKVAEQEQESPPHEQAADGGESPASGGADASDTAGHTAAAETGSSDHLGSVLKGGLRRSARNARASERRELGAGEGLHPTGGGGPPSV